MAYYIKLSSLSNWGSFHAITEVEAYSEGVKLTLTPVYATTSYPGWAKEKMTDGVTLSTSGYSCWLNSGSIGIQELIFRADAPIETVKVYAGTAYDRSLGSPRDVEIYTMQSSSQPSPTDPLWVLKDRKSYVDALVTYTHDLTIPLPIPVPIHQWKLTTDATDSIGGLATTNNGGVTFDAVNGASFNGIDQWLSFEKTLSPTYPFSMSIWAEFNPLTDCYFFTSCDTNFAGTTGAHYSPGGPVSAYVGYNNLGSLPDESTTINYPPNRFVLITLTWDGSSKACLYRGDVLILSKNISVSVISRYFSIGRSGSYNGMYFKGNLLDARIYNVALTQANITDLNREGANADSPKALPKRFFAWVGGV